MVPFRMPNFVGLLPSAEVAVNKPPPVDFLTPFVMEAIKDIKVATAEYRSAKTYQAESRNLSEYYRSKGMGDLAGLIEKQSAALGPDLGSALMGVNTEDARKRTMAGINAISAQEFKLKVDAADSKEKFNNQLELQRRSQNFSADQARLNDASNLRIADFNKRDSEIAQEERTLQDQRESVAKLNNLTPDQTAAALAEIETKQAALAAKKAQLNADRQTEVGRLSTPSPSNPVTNPNILGNTPADDSGHGGSQTDLPSRTDNTPVTGSVLPGVGGNPSIPSTSQSDPNQPVDEYLPPDGLVPPRARIVQDAPASNATTRTVSPNLTETPSVTQSKIPVTIARPASPDIVSTPKANPDATLPTTPTSAPKAAPNLTPTNQAIVQAKKNDLKVKNTVFDTYAGLIMGEAPEADKQNATAIINKAKSMLATNPEEAMKMLSLLDAKIKPDSGSGRTITSITEADIPQLKGTGIDLGVEVKKGVVILKVRGAAESQYKTLDVAINDHERNIGPIIAKAMIGGNPTAKEIADFEVKNPEYKNLQITYDQIVEAINRKSFDSSPSRDSLLQRKNISPTYVTPSFFQNTGIAPSGVSAPKSSLVPTGVAKTLSQFKQ